MCRRQWKRDRVVAVNNKVMQILSTKNTTLADDRNAVAALSERLGKPLTEWSFEEFFKLKVADMKNFCKARTPGVVQPWKGTLNKGDVDAVEDAQTLARVAWGMRNKPPVGTVLTLEDLGMQLEADSDRERSLVPLPKLVDATHFAGPLQTIATLSGADTKVYSDDPEWMRAVASTVIGYNASHVDSIPAQDLHFDVARVVKVLRARLQTHLRSRLVGKLTSLRTKWVWFWYAANIPRLAAMITWFGHTLSGQRIDFADRANMSILYSADPLTARFMPDNEPRVGGRASRRQSRRWNASTCGAYVHWDSAIKTWVRSGKVARAGGYLARQQEHKRSASKPVSDKLASFYRAYNMNGGSRGNFTSLRSFFAMGIDKHDVKSACELFHWSAHHKMQCRSASWKTFDEAAVHCISYAFELTYDLLLHPGASISTAPGFEGFLGSVYISHLRSLQK